MTETTEITDDEHGVELEPAHAAGRSPTPSTVADALARVIREKKLYARIRARSTSPSKAGRSSAACSASSPGSSGRARSRTDGRRGWKRAPWTAGSSARPRRVRSAPSRSGRKPTTTRSARWLLPAPRRRRSGSRFGFVMKLAGFDPTPAEEIDGTPPEVERPRRSAAEPVAVTVEQLEEVQTLLRSLRACEPGHGLVGLLSQPGRAATGADAGGGGHPDPQVAGGAGRTHAGRGGGMKIPDEWGEEAESVKAARAMARAPKGKPDCQRDRQRRRSVKPKVTPGQMNIYEILAEVEREARPAA